MTQLPYSDATEDISVPRDNPPDPFALALPVNVGAAAMVGGRLRVFGWSLREAAGTPAAARIDLTQGGSGLGSLIATIDINASGSTRDWFGPMGIRADGLYVNVVSGTVTGVIWVALE